MKVRIIGGKFFFDKRIAVYAIGDFWNSSRFNDALEFAETLICLKRIPPNKLRCVSGNPKNVFSWPIYVKWETEFSPR